MSSPALRVLFIHNYYRSTAPSGENSVVAAQQSALRRSGVEVAEYSRSSDSIDSFGPSSKLDLPLRPIVSFRDLAPLRARILEFRPHVVHLHNPYPLISPMAIRVAKTFSLPVVQSVHNYRFRCVNGLYFRAGRSCRDCSKRRFPWPAIAHACYRHSSPQSAVMAASLAAHHGTWQLIDRYLPVSHFVATELRAAGIPQDKIAIVPNATEDPGPPRPLGSGLVYAGRLEAQKGISLLLEAWRHPNRRVKSQLTIAGDGPDRLAVKSAAASDPSITYVGPLSQEEMGHALDSCAAQVIPSLCFEAFSLAAIEAFARGRPVVATNTGALTDLVTPLVGWTCQNSDPAELAATISRALSDRHALERRGSAARSLYEASYTPQSSAQALLNVYKQLAD